MTLNDAAQTEIRLVLGDAGYLVGVDIGPRYRSDARGEGDVTPQLVLRPETTDQVSRVMAICHRENQPVVVQGGMTGLVAGARPETGEVVISLERMNRIDNVDAETCTATVQAGTPLQTVQDAADAMGLLYPLDLGARGSCTIGGNLATNAGGNRVVRFGMTRDLTLGLEVVLANGTVVSNLSGFIKNNTGYDLKQLFIGSEGTLGIITRATLRLYRKPRTQVVAFCATDSFDNVVATLSSLQSDLGSDLSAFEVIWGSTYTTIVSEVTGITPALPTGSAYYILVEMLGSSVQHDLNKFETALERAMTDGLIADAVISQSEKEVRNLWDIRDGMAEAMGRQQPAVGFDISLAIADMKNLDAVLQQRLSAALGDAQLFIGGHLADGNLHLVAKKTGADPQPREQIEQIVYGFVGEIGGSVSAEHGIGTLKKEYLPQSRSPAEIAVMQTLKSALDPKGLLGSGRILPIHHRTP